MADAVVLESQARKPHGSGEARRMRRKGIVPGVLYGHKEETLSISLNGEDLEKIIRHGVRVVDLKAGGKVEKALIRAVQWDHLGKELLHVDFTRVALDERVVITVPLQIRGTAIGVTTGGGVLDQPMHTLSIECLAISVPDSIRVNVAELQLGQAIHVKELVLPEGVKAMADGDAVVVHVTLKQIEEVAPAPAAATAEAAEPEVITRAKPVAEEEEAE
jgi:large subunit ribosomal protein L25